MRETPGRSTIYAANPTLSTHVLPTAFCRAFLWHSAMSQFDSAAPMSLESVVQGSIARATEQRAQAFY